MLAGPRQFFAGWRGLGWFWLLVAVLLVVGGVTLQLIGRAPTRPPAPPLVAGQAPAHRPEPAAEPAEAGTSAGSDRPVGSSGPVATRPARSPIPTRPCWNRRQDRGPTSCRASPPMDACRCRSMPPGSTAAARRPRVGLLLAGVGLNQADSEAAIRALPRGVTLAISPYARNPAKLLAAARLAEHEYLLSIPMEPQGFPLNDPGKQALMTNLSAEQNRERLDWMLSRIAGYVGRGRRGGQPARRAVRLAARPDRPGAGGAGASAGCCMSIRARTRRRCRWSGAGAWTS